MMEKTGNPTATNAPELSAFEQYRMQQVQQMEDDLPEDCCMVEMPEGQFVRGH